MFILDDFDLDHSIDQFVHLYSLRQQSNHEFWLLDVSNFKNKNKIMEYLQNLQLDLDDDLFLFNNTSINNFQTELSSSRNTFFASKKIEFLWELEH